MTRLIPVLFFPVAALAQQETVVVTATRIPQAGFDVPAAIDAIDARAIREDNPQVNLSESLNRVPGIVVQNRQNYAQDLQISSRGFGARSTFGVRGVRLIADGIPATMPDGQGQAATFDLTTAERIEVLRGPFASLYGNASGGVVQLFTADGPPEPTVEGSVVFGSYGMHKEGVRFGGQAGALNYNTAISRFETDGYRDHSRALRDQLNAKLFTPLWAGRLSLVVNSLHQPDTQDPLGLSRAQFEADPTQADPSAILFDTRKSIRQNQAGLVYDFDGATNKVQARLYAGARRVTQYLAQSGDTPLGSGGVVDLDRGYGGVGARWTHVFEAVSLTVGADADRLDERRRGYVNNLGVQGALRRDEDDLVSNSDFYAQAEWRLDEDWSVNAGVRRSRVRFESNDHYVVGPNPDDSGGLSYSKTTPVAGLLYRCSDQLHFYANAGEGFETPTFAELAYRPGGATGLNFALKPATSRHYEAGAKGRDGSWLRWSASGFRIETRDEIVTNSSAGGRTDFKNASRTTRDGFELFAAGTVGAFEATLAYTWLDARFTEGFSSGSPPVAVAAGAKLPGVPKSVLQADLAWRERRSGFHAAVELRRSDKVYVNEANTDAAPAYTVANLRAGFEQRGRNWTLSEFVRVDNLGDRHYSGSVIVAAAGGRFFEPAPGRNYAAGIAGSWAF
jgi:iron complex outermembrane receptor protein